MPAEVKQAVWTAPIRILIAEDHNLVRQALKLLLEREGFEVVGEAGDGREAVRLAQSLSPDVAVLDVMMPLLNGIDAAVEIQHTAPQTRTIVLTMNAAEDKILAALRAGVRGFVAKTHEARDLIQAIQDVCRGSLYLSPRLSRGVIDAFLSKSEAAPDPLSPRERQVLQLIAEGKSTRQVAEMLGVSVKTAETHRARIIGKLNIRDTAGLVRYAINRGLSPL